LFELFLNRNKLLSDSKRLGRWGEKYCEKYLRSKGMVTLTRNFTCKTGEIDLVMVDTDSSLVFVEVKTRADDCFAQPEAGLTAAKKQRLAKAARYFLTVHDITARPYRFDVVAITLGAKGRPRVKLYSNAFVP